MKKLIIFSIMSLFLISSCRKSDNERIPELSKVPFPSVLKASGDKVLFVESIDAFNANFTVGLFYPDGAKPQKYDVMVIKNGDNSTAKLLQGDVTTFPTTVNITGAKLKTLFGTIASGDKFDVGVDITVDGRRFNAFPAVGVPYSSAAEAPPGSSLLIRYSVVCRFVPDEYAGDFEVTADGWNDIGIGETVPVTVVSATQLSFDSPVNGKPILVDVDPTSNETSIKRQEYGNYGDGNGIFFAQSVNSLNNFVDPCTGILSMQINYTATVGGSFGNFTLTMKKK